MSLPKSGQTSNTSDKVKEFRPPTTPETTYMPDQGSALLGVSEQARGMDKENRSKNTVQTHDHDGINSIPINLANLIGVISTVSSAPAWTPKTFIEQFAVYANASTYRFYIYDSLNKAWRYVALT